MSTLTFKIQTPQVGVYYACLSTLKWLSIYSAKYKHPLTSNCFAFVVKRCAVLHGSMRVPCYIVYKRVLLLLLFSKSRAMSALVECLDQGDTLSGETIQWAGLVVHLNSSPLDGTEMMIIVSGCHCMHSFLCHQVEENEGARWIRLTE